MAEQVGVRRGVWAPLWVGLAVVVAVLIALFVVHQVQAAQDARRVCELEKAFDGYGPADAKAACS